MIVIKSWVEAPPKSTRHKEPWTFCLLVVHNVELDDHDDNVDESSEEGGIDMKQVPRASMEVNR